MNTWEVVDRCFYGKNIKLWRQIFFEMYCSGTMAFFSPFFLIESSLFCCGPYRVLCSADCILTSPESDMWDEARQSASVPQKRKIYSFMTSRCPLRQNVNLHWPCVHLLFCYFRNMQLKINIIPYYLLVRTFESCSGSICSHCEQMLGLFLGRKVYYFFFQWVYYEALL